MTLHDAATDLLNQLALLTRDDESYLWRIGGRSLDDAYKALKAAVAEHTPDALESQLGSAHAEITRLTELAGALYHALDGTTHVLADHSNNRSRAWQWARNIVAANKEALAAWKESKR